MFGRRTTSPWFFQSSVHQEALNRALYSIESAVGTALVYGVDGAGRSSLLKDLQHHLSRQSVAVASVNATALDQESLLWHLADQLAVSVPDATPRSGLILKIRDELLGRARCGVRSVMLLDDVHRGSSDLQPLLHYVQTMASASEGYVSAVVTASTPRFAAISGNPSLKIELRPLGLDETRSFIQSLLTDKCGSRVDVDESGIWEIFEVSGGFPGSLMRICEFILVAAEVSPSLKVDSQVIREIVQDVIPRAVA